MQKAIKEKFEILQVDESTFKAKDHRRQAWSLPGKHQSVIKGPLYNTKHSVIAAISSDGKIYYSMKEKDTIVSEDVLGFLKDMLDRYAGRKLCIFWDNARIHTAGNV